VANHLYRHFDQEGCLLYIGVSISALHRFVQHRAAEWFLRIKRVEIESFATREEALLAESAAIKSEKPLFNIAHKQKVEKQKVEKQKVEKRKVEKRKVEKEKQIKNLEGIRVRLKVRTTFGRWKGTGVVVEDYGDGILKIIRDDFVYSDESIDTGHVQCCRNEVSVLK
jgi:hypothetical protein